MCLMGPNIKKMLRDMKIELPFVVFMYRSKFKFRLKFFNLG